MTRLEAQRIVRGYLAGHLLQGAFGDALADAGVSAEDAPELRDTRPEFRAKALAARDALAAICPPFSAVTLRDVRFDKYGGRILARLTCVGGDPAEALQARGLAREYRGRGKKPW